MIIPAIIGKDFNEVEVKALSVTGLVPWVHLDIMDGLFTPTESWPYLDIKEGPSDLQYIDFIRTDNLKAEVHLMVGHPEKNLSKWIEVGADRILIHYESANEGVLNGILDELESSEVEAGMVLKFETPIEGLDKFIDKLDVVQLMSIAHIGSYGQPFEEEIYDKIKSLRADYPGVIINVDGGVSLENAPKLIAAGADNLVVGSAIFGSENIPAAIKRFREIGA